MSSNSLTQFDQRKALRIIRSDEPKGRDELYITSLDHRRKVAAVTVLYKKHADRNLADLHAGSSFVPTTRTSQCIPPHALSLPCARTGTLDGSFLHMVIRIWNSLLEAVVGNISSDGIQTFKKRKHRHHLSSILY